MKNKRTVDLGVLVRDGALVKAAIRRAGMEAMRQHIRDGASMVSWRDGNVVMLTPEELTVMLEQYDREDAENKPLL